MVTKKKVPFQAGRSLKWQYNQSTPDAADKGSPLQLDVDVGSRLRRLREARRLTLRSLAELSGLAVNTLSLIENGRSSPSVSTLQQLALALQVPIIAFFETDVPKSKVAHILHDRRPRALFEHGYLEDLGAGAAIQAVEPFFVCLEPDADSGPQEIVHTGYEFIYCLEGRIAYTIESNTYLLEPGDSLLFEAHLPHRWKNLSAGTSKSILVLYPTDERDFPTERHFVSD